MTSVQSADRRRLLQSLTLSLCLWAVLTLVFAVLKYEGAEPKDSMNPVWIELAPPVQPPEMASVSASNRQASAAAQSQASAPQQDAPVSRVAPAAAPASEAQARSTTESVQSASAAESAALRSDPAAAPLPAARATRRSSSFQGGADPFAPLSEDALAAAPAAAAPVPDQAAAPETRSSAPVGVAPSADSGLTESLERLQSNLDSTQSDTRTGSPSSASASIADAVASPAGSAGPSGFDFGDGPTRSLNSPKNLRIPDRLLADQPDRISTTVSFMIDPNGVVLPSTIRFSPPLKRDLEDFLRMAFSAWQFTPADNNGQVVFGYSIKVR
jgi:hypothetical protein